MKNLIKTLALGLFIAALANCGGGGGGGGEESAPKTGLDGQAQEIIINDGQSGGPVYWSSNYNNIYFDVIQRQNGECVTGLAREADDATYDAALEEMRGLLNAADVQAGTGEDFAYSENSMPRVTVMSDGGTEVYYLVDREDVPSSEKVLSNADEIIEYYDEVLNELSSRGYYYCPGKGDTLPGNDND